MMTLYKQWNDEKSPGQLKALTQQLWSEKSTFTKKRANYMISWISMMFITKTETADASRR